MTVAARYQTAAEWVHALGDIPLDRIITDPWPGSATEADLLRKVEVEKRLCELVEGTLVEKPMGWVDSPLAMRLGKFLLDYVTPRHLGVVSGPDGPLRLARGLVRIPDVAFFSYQRLPNGKIPADPIPSLAPDLAVEILSPSNTPAEMDRKLAEYFRAGAQEVWILNPATRSATIYPGLPDIAQEVGPHGTLHTAKVLPGFSLPMPDLFEGLE